MDNFDKKLLNSMCFHLNKKILDYQNAADIIKHFYLYQQKLILPVPRKCHKSKEFNVSLSKLNRYQRDCIKIIIQKIKDGDDLTPYLSKKIKQKRLDRLLIDWGIYHLHLEKKRSNVLIFCMFNGYKAYLINIKDHNNYFSDQELLSIIDRQWGFLKQSVIDLNFPIILFFLTQSKVYIGISNHFTTCMYIPCHYYSCCFWTYDKDN